MRVGIALGLKMGNPHSAVDRADADRALASRQNLSGWPFETLLLMRTERLLGDDLFQFPGLPA